jgi:hypothetical protein
MTAVMRAVAQQAGPKVLRIGLVQAGRVIEERIIKQRTSVVVGQNEKSTFVVPTPNIPPQFKLFELIGSDYYLNFLDGMSGRVALATGISDLAALRGQAKRVGPAYQVRLTEEARGKVVIGDITFLFQFVAPPPPQPRPQLPLSVKGGLASQIDWTLTIIAAFSFMFHFGFIGAMYSDWLDPVVGEENIQGLIDMTKNLPAPPPIEDKSDQPTDQSSNQPSKDVKKDTGETKPNNQAPGKISDQKAAALAQEAQAMQMQMLAAFGGTTAVQGALNRSDVPVGDLSAVAQSAAGVTNTGGDLHLAAGGGATIPGQRGSLNQLGQTGGGGGGQAGATREVKGPTGDAQTGSISTSAPVANAEAAIARLRPGFRSCYNKGLANDPSMAGKIVLAIKIAPNGDVNDVSKVGGSGLSSDVEQCIIKRAKGGTFEAPGGSGSTIQVPVTFVKQ